MNFHEAAKLVELLKKCKCEICQNEIERLKKKYEFDRK